MWFYTAHLSNSHAVPGSSSHHVSCKQRSAETEFALRRKRGRRHIRAGTGSSTAAKTHLMTGCNNRTTVSDRRAYHFIRLANGLRVMLVSDPEAVFAASCLSVQLGYFDDPDEFPGMAHYLEHAVHLGSEKFPDEKEYKSYLSEHGGTSNASTGLVHTNYHFKVTAEHLGGALDRFAHMFASPLLSQESVVREVENVHAEFSRNCNLDSRQMLQLQRSLRGAPYNKFSTGNIDTLREALQQAGKEAAVELRRLWQEYYLAGNMTTAVIGPQTLHELEALVRSSLSYIRPSEPAAVYGTTHTPSSATSCRYHLDVCGEQHRGLLVRIAPMRDLREMELQWFIPESRVGRYKESKPWRWASHLLGHEGVGSVAAALKLQGLIQDLNTGMGEDVGLGRGFMFWRVNIKLTEEGEELVEEVVGTVFQGIQVLCSCTHEQREATWKELAQVSLLSWQYRDREQPVDLVKAIAHKLHYHPPGDVLYADALLAKYDDKSLTAFLQHLTVDAVTMFWTSKKFAGATNQKEAWYGAAYCVEKLPEAWKKKWGGAGAAGQVPVEGLRLPEPNWALPKDLTLCGPEGVSPCEHSTAEYEAALGEKVILGAKVAAGKNRTTAQLVWDKWVEKAPEAVQAGVDLSLGENGTTERSVRDKGIEESEEALPDVDARAGQGVVMQVHPQMLVDRDVIRVWHTLDTSFGIPKVELRLHVVTPEVYRSPHSLMTTRLLLRILEDVLMPHVYHASLVSTSYSLHTATSGVMLTVAGFSDVAPKLLSHVLEGLVGLGLYQITSRLEVMRGKMQQQLLNWRNNPPVSHAGYALEHLLQCPHWHVDDLLAVLPDVTAQQVASCWSSLSSSLYLELLAAGNISSLGAIQAANIITSILKPRPLPVASWPEIRTLSLQFIPWSSTLHRLPTTQPEAANNSHAGKKTSSESGTTLGTVALDALGNEATGRHVQEEGAVGIAAGRGPGPAPVQVLLVPKNPNPSNTNHGLLYYLQVGPDDFATAVHLELFSSMSKKACFYQLRTRERLGYSVSLSVHYHQGILGLQVRVQSPSTDPAKIQERLTAWLSSFRKDLLDMSDTTFQNYKAALRETYMEPPKSLSEANSRAWHHIKNRSYQFHRRSRKAEHLSKLVTPATLISFYDTYLGPFMAPCERLVACQVWGGCTGLPPALQQELAAAKSCPPSAGCAPAVEAASPAAALAVEAGSTTIIPGPTAVPSSNSGAGSAANELGARSRRMLVVQSATVTTFKDAQSLYPANCDLRA